MHAVPFFSGRVKILECLNTYKLRSEKSMRSGSDSSELGVSVYEEQVVE